MPSRLDANAQHGFTLIELIAVLVILGSLAAVAVPAFLDMRVAARDALTANTAGALRAGLDAATNAWRVRGTGNGAVTNLAGWRDGTADFDADGDLMGTSYAGGAINEANCMEIWRLAFANSPPLGGQAAGTAPPNSWQARYMANAGCIYVMTDGAGALVLDLAGTNGVYIGYDPRGELHSSYDGRVWSYDQTGVTKFWNPAR